MHLIYLATLLPLLAAASSVNPPVVPLAVRNPYLSSWLRIRDKPWSKWPIFWNGADIGMSIMAHVPSSQRTYPLLGRPQDSLPERFNVSYPEYLGLNFDASTTNFTYQIPAPDSSQSPLELVVSFMSPVTPSSTLRQSIPASYVSIHAKGDFDVEVYMDLNGLWASGNRGSPITWSMTKIKYHESTTLQSWQVKRREEQLFTEFNEHSEWGRLYFTGPSDAHFESGTSAVLRQGFASTGTLKNQVDQRFRSVMDQEPVFAFHSTLKAPRSNSSSSESSTVMYTIALVQDPVAQFASSRGLTLMKPLWKAWFQTDEALLAYHYLDFETAKGLAADFADKLTEDSLKSGSYEYRDIVSLSARQVLGGTVFTGTPENPLLFLKEISSDGNTQTVDVIFPAFPFFLYANPRWLAYLLEPLLEHQLSGQYPNKYSMHDLGAHFPNFTGHADGRDEYMPVEECGDMLIMGLAVVNSIRNGAGQESSAAWPIMNVNEDTLAIEKPENDNEHAAFSLRLASRSNGIEGLDEAWVSGDSGKRLAKQWLEKTYKMWKQWTEYLVEFSLQPGNQLSTDDFAGWLPLQTNLALKGIIGIKAMGELSAVMGNHTEYNYYKNISDTYAAAWQTFGMTRDGAHAKLAYDWYGSWTTLYSLFPSTVLCFQNPSSSSSSSLASSSSLSPFLPHALYTNQSTHYSLVLQNYGLPLDSRHLYTKSDWEMEAAAVASPQVRDAIIQKMAKWLNETTSDLPFTDLYETEGRGGFGAGARFAARPVVGGHFARLVVERACGGNAEVEGLWGGQ